MKRTLNLKRERVVELTTDELSGVVGAVRPESISCPLDDCIGSRLTCPGGCDTGTGSIVC